MYEHGPSAGICLALHAGALTAAIEGGDLRLAAGTGKAVKVRKLGNRLSCIYLLLKAKYRMKQAQRIKLTIAVEVASTSVLTQEVCTCYVGADV